MRAKMFEMSIVKTVDMSVEAHAPDDEVRLVVLQQNRRGVPSSAGSVDGWELQMQRLDHVYDGRT